MLTHEGRLHALITRYTELTNRNELDWEATSDTDTFWADVPPDNGVSVESTAGGYPYTFTIFARDPSGAAHGQWSPIETIRTLGPEDRVGPWDEPVRELFLAARMQPSTSVEPSHGC
jgi:hypothetical protein